jgi:hypothetical protein
MQCTVTYRGIQRTGRPNTNLLESNLKTPLKPGGIVAMSYLYNQENAHNPPGATIYISSLEPLCGDK